MHNTFSIIEGELVQAQSHNFPEFIGEGLTKDKAITDLNRKLMHYKDNYKREFEFRVKDRLQKGLVCLCGQKLDSDPIAVYKGKV